MCKLLGINKDDFPAIQTNIVSIFKRDLNLKKRFEQVKLQNAIFVLFLLSQHCNFLKNKNLKNALWIYILL